MYRSNHTSKPKFAPYVTWAACSRCNCRVPYKTLERERLTGLLVCGPRSGRAVRYCRDPWPKVYDFQAFPDKSIEPPPEPLPLRYNLDNIWGSGPDSGTTTTFANAPAPAPDDATRLSNLLSSVPYYAQLGKSAAFMSPVPVGASIQNLTTIIPANYDGTFLPSSSIRTVTPPDEGTELAALQGPGTPVETVWGAGTWGGFPWSSSDAVVQPTPWAGPPWSQVKGV